MKNALFAALIFLGSVGASAQCTINSYTTTPSVTAGQPMTLSVNVSGATSYQWYEDTTGSGIPIAGATSASYTFTTNTDLSDWGRVFSVQGSCTGGAGSFGTPTTWVYVTPPDTPTTTVTQFLGIQTAALAANNFGLVTGFATDDTEFARIAAMGGKWLRTDACSWENFETQTLPTNVSTGFNPSAACRQMIASTKAHGLKVDELSYWAPTNGTTAQAVLAAPIAIGDTTVSLTITSGSISSGCPASDILLQTQNNTALQYVIDNGAWIRSFSGSTFTLINPAIGAEAAGDAVNIRCLLYPPVVIAPASNPQSYVSNPSMQRWMAYLSAQQNYFASQDLEATFETLNEPEQATDSWDFTGFEDPSPPPQFTIGGDGRAGIFVASFLPAVPKERICNGWTNLSADRSVWSLDQNVNLQYLNDFVSTNNSIGCEYVHPYYNQPEQVMSTVDQVQKAVSSRTFGFTAMTIIGGQVGSNFKSMVYSQRQAYTRGGAYPAVSESGGFTDPVHQARGNARQWLSFTGEGMRPVIYYILDDQGNCSNVYQWFDYCTQTNMPTGDTFTRMMADINAISGPVIGPVNECLAPQIVSYSGYWPGDHTTLVGTRAGATANSYLRFVWQQTYPVTPPGETGEGQPVAWDTVASPPSVPITVHTHSNESVVSAVDLVTFASVTVTPGANNTYVIAAVNDDPLEFDVEPNTGATPNYTCVVDQ